MAVYRSWLFTAHGCLPLRAVYRPVTLRAVYPLRAVYRPVTLRAVYPLRAVIMPVVGTLLL